MKKYKTGVVIGKFYPPHKGHKFLIDTASSQTEKLTVIVCDKKGQTIPGEIRARWLREMHPEITVIVINDIYPDDDSQTWAKKTVEWLGAAPEVVFTSEGYGPRYAKLMGSEHVSVDLERKSFPISGTSVRENPLKEWGYLEAPVRAYFVKRICAVGAESTGTTTISRELAKHYQTVWVPEYGRTYWEGKLSNKDQSWQTQEFVHIATMQNLMEDQLAGVANKLLFCDTNSFATEIWHRRYLNSFSDEVHKLAEGRKYDLYLLTDTDIPFEQDGTRDGQHIRQWMHELFVEELEKRNLKYVLLSGSREKRLLKAVEEIDKLLA